MGIMLLLRAASLPLTSALVASSSMAGPLTTRAGPLSQLKRFRSGGVSSSLDGPGPVSEMVPVLVEVEVKPERLDEFLEVMRQDAVGSRTEPGCLRFDVM